MYTCLSSETKYNVELHDVIMGNSLAGKSAAWSTFLAEETPVLRCLCQVTSSLSYDAANSSSVARLGQIRQEIWQHWRAAAQSKHPEWIKAKSYAFVLAQKRKRCIYILNVFIVPKIVFQFFLIWCCYYFVQFRSKRVNANSCYIFWLLWLPYALRRQQVHTVPLNGPRVFLNLTTINNGE